jgi:predicted nucleic acid-binding protein
MAKTRKKAAGKRPATRSAGTKGRRYVYSFGGGRADGRAAMKDLLGGAVLARITPATAEKDLALLQALEIPTDDSPLLLGRACSLAIELRQHLFDTLYHAVALENPDCTLITADERYLDSGAHMGRVIRLTDWKG